MGEKTKKISLNLDSALDHVDGVCANYSGTRTDHQVLQASMQLLRQAVDELRRLQAIEAKAKKVADDQLDPLKTNGKTAKVTSIKKTTKRRQPRK
jgi:hypothetical protein